MIQWIRRRLHCLRFGHKMQLDHMCEFKERVKDKTIFREFFTCKVCGHQRIDRPKGCRRAEGY